MTVYTLVLTACFSGFWGYCSKGAKEVKVENLPSSEICEQVKKQYYQESDPNNISYSNGKCYPQVKK